MRTLRYLFSIGFICIAIATMGQEEFPERQVFIRPGIDLSRIALPFMGEYRNVGFEASVDAEIKYNYFPVIEAGWNQISDDRLDYQYACDGYYGRIGLNYNMLKYKHRLDRNIFFIGARYAHSFYQHQFDNIQIENEWGSLNTSLPATNLNADWVEGVIGLRGEVAKNLYLGYTIRVKVMLTRNEFGNFSPYFIPGFGEGTKTTAMGMSFTMSYAIPIKDVKIE